MEPNSPPLRIRSCCVIQRKTFFLSAIVPLFAPVSCCVPSFGEWQDPAPLGNTGPTWTASYTRPVNFRKRYYRILAAAGLERRGLHALRHTFATNLVNGVKQPDGSFKALSPRQVADLLGHSTSEITELYYVKKDTGRLAGITAGFEL